MKLQFRGGAGFGSDFIEADVSREYKSAFIRLILAIIRPFKYVSHLEVNGHYPWHELSGTMYMRLIREAKSILEEEIRVDKQGKLQRSLS
jgi:hypothetical protein